MNITESEWLLYKFSAAKLLAYPYIKFLLPNSCEKASG